MTTESGVTYGVYGQLGSYGIGIGYSTISGLGFYGFTQANLGIEGSYWASINVSMTDITFSHGAYAGIATPPGTGTVVGSWETGISPSNKGNTFVTAGIGREEVFEIGSFLEVQPGTPSVTPGPLDAHVSSSVANGRATHSDNRGTISYGDETNQLDMMAELAHEASNSNTGSLGNFGFAPGGGQGSAGRVSESSRPASTSVSDHGYDDAPVSYSCAHAREGTQLNALDRIADDIHYQRTVATPDDVAIPILAPRIPIPKPDPYSDIGPNGDAIPGVACFAPGTLISLGNGAKLPIEQIAVQRDVLSFAQDGGVNAALTQSPVTRLYENVTEAFIEFTYIDPATGKIERITSTHGCAAGHTPGHTHQQYQRLAA